MLSWGLGSKVFPKCSVTCVPTAGFLPQPGSLYKDKFPSFCQQSFRPNPIWQDDDSNVIVAVHGEGVIPKLRDLAGNGI